MWGCPLRGPGNDQCSVAPRLSGYECIPVWRINPIYPVARGASPLLITLFTIVTVPGVLKTTEVICNFGFWGDHNLWHCTIPHQIIVLAVITGCFIASYSIVDATGTDYTECDKLLWGVYNCQCGIVGFLSNAVFLR